MTIFTMFFIELLVSRFDIFGEHEHEDVEAADPAADLITRSRPKDSDEEEKYDSTKGKQHLL